MNSLNSFKRLALIVSILSLLPLAQVLAAWDIDGNAICTAPSSQFNPAIVSDGAGGAIIAWLDHRDPGSTMYPWEIYVQRVNPKGDDLWTSDGIGICSVHSDIPEDFSIVRDGAGGAIIAWADTRNYATTHRDIFVQRVDSLGTLLWPAEGVPVCTTIYDQTNVRMIPHHEGGAIIVWEDPRSGTGDTDIYAQRVDEYGTALWTENGEPICTHSARQQVPAVVPDGFGGAIVAWEDYRNTFDWDIYAQRVDALGATQWAADGAAVCTTTAAQRTITMMPLPASGAIVCWVDSRNGPETNIYAQRIDLSGHDWWDGNGRAVCVAPGYAQDQPAIAPADEWGAIIAFRDTRYGTAGYNIFAQRMSFSGIRMWGDGGSAVCLAINDQEAPAIVSDGQGGAIIAWESEIMDTLDIYAQRLDESGAECWTSAGVEVCSAPDRQFGVKLVSDYNEGAFLTWNDVRWSASSIDIFAQRLRADGGIEPDSLPDPTYSYVEWVNTVCPDGNVFVCPCGSGSHVFAMVRNEYDEAVESAEVVIGVLGNCDICRCEPVTAITDETGIATLYISAGVDASGSSECCLLTTIVQCMGVGIPWFNTDGLLEDTRVWFSPDLNGDCTVNSQDSLIIYYEDLYTTACRTDFDCSGFVDDVLDFAQTFLPHLDDNCAEVVAVEDGKQSSRHRVALVQNYPNPFNPLTRIVFSISEPGWTNLRVYDIAGRPVCTLVEGWRGSGVQEVIWDGRDDNGKAVASGVYFYQLEAPGYKKSKKMVLLR